MPVFTSITVAMPSSALFSPQPLGVGDGLHDTNVMDQEIHGEDCSAISTVDVES
jgi:hypothetical protein